MDKRDLKFSRLRTKDIIKPLNTIAKNISVYRTYLITSSKTYNESAISIVL